MTTDPDLLKVITKSLESALTEAEKLVEDGWSNEDSEPIIFNRLQGEPSQSVDPVVWIMMKAISRGIGMKSKWDRENRTGQGAVTAAT